MSQNGEHLDLDTLARQINDEHAAGEAATRKGLAHYRAAGEALSKAREACKRAKRPWLPWLKKNCPNVKRARAYHYIALHEFLVTRNLTPEQEEAESEWRRISGNAPTGDAQDEPEAIKPLPPEVVAKLKEGTAARPVPSEPVVLPYHDKPVDTSQRTITAYASPMNRESVEGRVLTPTDPLQKLKTAWQEASRKQRAAFLKWAKRDRPRRGENRVK
jgi:hypothetical protein